MEKKPKTQYTKKGQLADAAVGNIVTLIVGVGVAVLVLIFVGSLGGQTYQLVEDDIEEIAENLITDEQVTVLNQTTVQLNHNFIQEGTLTLTNGSVAGPDVGLGNFTIDYDDGSLTLLATGDGLNNTLLFANYTWGSVDVRNAVQEGIVSGFEGLEQTGDYLPIIVLAVVIALVLSLVLGFTAFGNRGLSGGAL